MRALILGVMMAVVIGNAQAATTYDDLHAVILLQGQTCPQVTTFEKRGEDDWIAKCIGGISYRVYRDDQGKVRVVKR